MDHVQKESIEPLRRSLLALHKSLLDYQTKDYEGKYGKIPTPGKLFELVTGNGEFAWLRTLSELIVSMDDLLDAKKEGSEQQTADLLGYVKSLLQNSSGATVFSRKYAESLQKDPGVALAHAQVLQYLK